MAITAVYGGFRTGWNQREVRVMAKCASGTLSLKVGEVCTLSAAGVIAKKDSVTINRGDVIIAQSDMTMGKGHAPVENHNYNYVDTVSISTTSKPIMVFYVNDPDDVYETSHEGSAT